MQQYNAQYYEAKQCSPQWRAFLAAFATQFASKGDVKDLRNLMHDLGRTMAQQFPLHDGSSLDALQAGMNRVWSEIDWGWVELTEEAEALVVAHHISPLKVAFGAESLGWSPALLEGIYAQWFEKLGMDTSLQLTQRGNALEDGQLFIYELKKKREETSYFTRR